MSEPLIDDFQLCKRCRRPQNTVSVRTYVHEDEPLRIFELECGHAVVLSTHTQGDPNKTEVWR